MSHPTGESVSSLPRRWQFGLLELFGFTVATALYCSVAIRWSIPPAILLIVSAYGAWATALAIRRMRSREIAGCIFSANAAVFAFALMLPSFQMWAAIRGWQAAWYEGVVLVEVIWNVVTSGAAIVPERKDLWQLAALASHLTGNVLLVASPVLYRSGGRWPKVASVLAVVGAVGGWAIVGDSSWYVGFYVWLMCLTIQAIAWTSTCVCAYRVSLVENEEHRRDAKDAEKVDCPTENRTVETEH